MPTRASAAIATPVTATSAIDLLAQEWRERVTAQLSASTADAYSHALDHYLRYLEEAGVAPEVATSDEITQYVAHCRARCREHMPHQRPLRRQGASSSQAPCVSMLRIRLSALRSFYDTLVAQDVCERNPLRSGVRLCQLARGEPVVHALHPAPPAWTLSRREVAALVTALTRASARDRLVVALLLDTGLSPHELCALTIHDVDIRQQSLVVTLTERAGAGDTHSMYCSPVTTRLYRHYMRARPTARSAPAALLLSESYRNAGQAIGSSTIDKTLKRIALEAGVSRFTVRSLRRTRALLEEQAPYQTIECLDSSPGPQRSMPETPRARLLGALFEGVADGEALQAP